MTSQPIMDDQDHLGRSAGYLPIEQSGASWMLDPKDSTLQRHANHQSKGPSAAANHAAHIDDAPSLKHLLRHRHVGVVLNPEKARVTDYIVDRWIQRLSDAEPSTLAACAGTLGEDLGIALGDGHLHVRHGEHHHTAKETLGEDLGSAWESVTMNGIRTVRIRPLNGSDDTIPPYGLERQHTLRTSAFRTSLSICEAMAEGTTPTSPTGSHRMPAAPGGHPVKNAV